jgi:glyoxylase-like metal-dependent hydrolase (beta-lactamase superfamily II)
VSVDPTHIFLTHGHADHIGDTVDIAKRTGAQTVAIVELANELGSPASENVADPNIGGTVESKAAGCASHRRGTPRCRRTALRIRRPGS